MAAPREVETAANGLRFETLLAGPEGGEAVILLHGYPQSAAMWTETMEWLDDRGYRSIAPNLRGYSPRANPPSSRAFRMDSLVDDVIGIADAQGVERFHLIGHDWGGALAWAVAGSHPERLLSLTSVSTPHGAAMARAMRSSTQALRSSYMGFFRIPRLPEALLQLSGPLQMGLSLRLVGQSPSAWQRDRAQLRRVGMRGPLNWYRGALVGLRPRPVEVPTMYVWGRHDPFLGRRAAELTAEQVTGPYRFEELDAGHWIPDRNAADLQALLGEHLAANQAPGPVSAAATRDKRVEEVPASRPRRGRRGPGDRAAKPTAAKPATPRRKKAPKSPS